MVYYIYCLLPIKSEEKPTCIKVEGYAYHKVDIISANFVMESNSVINVIRIVKWSEKYETEEQPRFKIYFKS